MNLLAFDPSLSCTGWAVLREDGPTITLVDFGDFATKGEELFTRLAFIRQETKSRLKTYSPDYVAVELPQAGFVRGAKRSNTHLPSYGMAVGMVLAACIESGVPVVTVTADEWGRRIARGGKGQAKTNRIGAVRIYLGVDLMETYKSEVRASGVADAALMGHHAFAKVRRGGLFAA